MSPVRSECSKRELKRKLQRDGRASRGVVFEFCLSDCLELLCLTHRYEKGREAGEEEENRRGGRETSLREEILQFGVTLSEPCLCAGPHPPEQVKHG